MLSTQPYTLSLHDALPILWIAGRFRARLQLGDASSEMGVSITAYIGLLLAVGLGRLVEMRISARSEEHTSELQSRGHLVCRLLLEKKNCLLQSILCFFLNL